MRCSRAASLVIVIYRRLYNVKLIAINGSPRKSWNNATLLNKTIEGARAAGTEAELIHLYDLTYKGCTSCFVCKLIDSPSKG